MENNDLTNNTPSDKMYSQGEVEEMIRKRTERERENSRLKQEELDRKASEASTLRKQLEELEKKQEKGTATTQEMETLQTAKQAAQQGTQQGYSQEEVQAMIDFEMKKKSLTNNIREALEKDPEFKKLFDAGGKSIPEHLVAGTAYLPNATAVIKHLMKDKKSLELYAAAAANAPYDNAVSAMQILNNFSDKLAGSQEKPHPSTYEPSAPLSDASDEDQNFDESDYVKNKY